MHAVSRFTMNDVEDCRARVECTCGWWSGADVISELFEDWYTHKYQGDVQELRRELKGINDDELASEGNTGTEPAEPESY